MFRNYFLKYNEAGDKGTGNGTPPPADDKTPPTPAAANPPPVQKAGNLDEFGYDKQAADEPGKEGTPAPKEGEKPPEKKPEEKAVEPVSGYADEPPKADPEEKPAEKPPEKPKDDGLGYELDVKDLDPKDAEEVKNFAKAMGLNEDQAKKYVEFQKGTIAAIKAADADYDKQVKANIIKEKAAWHKELKDDPDFGGEKFSHSVARVDKFMNDFMPDTKKVLTERKSMLPPYVMKDFLRAANRFYETEKLVQGNEITGGTPAADKKEKNPWDFYNS